MKQQPRDAVGRFASTNTSGNPKAEAVKRVAKERAGTKPSPYPSETANMLMRAAAKRFKEKKALGSVTSPPQLRRGLKTWQDHHDEVLQPVHRLAAAEHLLTSLGAAVRNVQGRKSATVSTRYLILSDRDRRILGSAAPKQAVLDVLQKAVSSQQRQVEQHRAAVKTAGLDQINPGIASDNNSIAAALEDSLDERSVKKLGVSDQHGNLQAMAAYSHSPDHPDYLYVDFLATAPWNLGGDDPRATRRSGATVLSRLVDESAKIGLGGKLKLEPVEDAEPFYRHMGFVQDDEGYMRLDETSAKRLKERYG